MSASTFHMNDVKPGAALIESDTMTSIEARALLYRSLTTTVPKELVHRASVAEVMLTDWERVHDEHFSVAAQWPRGHSFFANVDGCHDPLIAAETIRQAGTLLAHAEFGVPLGHHFLMWDLSVSVQPTNLHVGTTPASVDVEMTCQDVKRRGDRLAGCRYNAVIRRNGQVAVTGSANFTCASPKVYERLRGEHGDAMHQPLPLTAPTAPQNVGRVSPMDVVLSPIGEPDRWLLRVDTRHPILFDHPVDHVPGMVLLEAARQAGTALLGHPCLPLDITSEFKKYVELDAPCVIEARRLPDSGTDRGERVLVTAYQDEAPVFRSTVTMAPVAE
ncbi:ScbA/BarX family gamma-butyrolactone biosynthesis protein [Streptomyces sp. RG80]|uniref:ScbA/BarX family gamma-butyrolactone biosynthesis protein n=1 Tax=Streptomyces sp. RG80 TaxID=3157340 RepID=UPI00338EAD4E